MFASIDDEPSQLLRLLAGLPARRAVDDVLARVTDALAQLAPAFAHAIRRLFADSRAIPSVDALAAAGETRRSHLRWLAHAELRGLTRLLVAAQVLRAALLVRAGLALAHAVRSLGTSETCSLALHVRGALHLRPAPFRQADLSLVYERLERFLRAEPRRVTTPAGVHDAH